MCNCIMCTIKDASYRKRIVETNRNTAVMQDTRILYYTNKPRDNDKDDDDENSVVTVSAVISRGVATFSALGDDK